MRRINRKMAKINFLTITHAAIDIGLSKEHDVLVY